MILTLATAALAMSCTVTKVLDGDTLVASCPSAPAAHVRLAEIDAPEKLQPYGGRSTASLRRMCLGKPATIIPVAADRYGRIVARVTCAGTDANAEQVIRGYAWAYTRYLRDPSIAEYADHARAERLGLWRSPHPIEPGKWRKGER